MRMKFFLPCLLALIAFIAFSYGYRIQNPTLVVTVYMNLHVSRESIGGQPGFGWILEQNTSASVVKWPQTAVENTYVDPIPRFTSNETRTTPVYFAVSVYLDGTNKTVLIPDNLIITGDYSAQVVSSFSSVGQGTYNLTMVLYVPGYEDYKDHLTRFITIP